MFLKTLYREKNVLTQQLRYDLISFFTKPKERLVFSQHVGVCYQNTLKCQLDSALAGNVPQEEENFSLLLQMSRNVKLRLICWFVVFL